ncbi:unnamed protein product [Ranitomeya imitator]|uniref:Uncharacterized protein n=1 Tax=Ranitomeya imitator TaxID=111125 RepID=A0ABN9LFM5_9NEOB|nr:unnamed protein product [Ranitomeya imitator]
MRPPFWNMAAPGEEDGRTPPGSFPTPATKISPKEEERKDESPASWRLGLRKTGSYGALSEITASKEGQKERDFTGVMRSASSPRLSSSLDNKEKEKDARSTRLAYVAPSIPRRLASTSDIEEKENRESSIGLSRLGGSYARRRWDDDLKKNSSVNEILNSSYQGSDTDNDPDRCSVAVWSLESCHTDRSPATNDAGNQGKHRPSVLQRCALHSSCTGCVSTAAGKQSGDVTALLTGAHSQYRRRAEHSAGGQTAVGNGSFGRRHDDHISSSIPSTTSGSTPTITSSGLTRSLSSTFSTSRSTIGSSGLSSRSYLTPVRDEESESQRKARSRQARQSRRSTQPFPLLATLRSQECIAAMTGHDVAVSRDRYIITGYCRKALLGTKRRDKHRVNIGLLSAALHLVTRCLPWLPCDFGIVEDSFNDAEVFPRIGVTLTDLQEAEKTIGRSRPTQTKDQESEEKQDKEKQEEKKEAEIKNDDYRYRFSRSVEERYRPSSTSTSAVSSSAPSLSSSTSSLYSSSLLNRPSSLTGLSSSYSNLSRFSSKEPEREALAIRMRSSVDIKGIHIADRVDTIGLYADDMVVFMDQTEDTLPKVITMIDKFRSAGERGLSSHTHLLLVRSLLIRRLQLLPVVSSHVVPLIAVMNMDPTPLP